MTRKRTAMMGARAPQPARFLHGRSALLQRAGLALFVAATLARAAAAEDPERTQARELGYAGVKAYVANDFVTANLSLEEAYRLVPVPSLGLWSGRALVKLGKWVEAEERYRSVSALVVNASDSEVQRKAQEDAALEREQLLSQLPSVLIEVSNASSSEVSAALDGIPIDSAQIGLERWVNPGRHVVVGVRGIERTEQAFEIRASERKQVQLRFTAAAVNAHPTHVSERPDAAPASSLRGTLRDAGWVALAAGGAGLVTGSFAYWIGQNRYDTLERHDFCARGACEPGDVDAYNTWRAVHLTGLIAGGVLGAAGLGLLLATPDEADDADPKATVTLRFDAQTLMLGGSF